MLRRLMFLLLGIGLPLVFPLAAAGTWPLAAPAEMILGFGSTYSYAGTVNVHRGIDLAAPAGSEVLSPVDGEVAFSGSVPGDGATIRVITVLADDGRRVSLSPVEDPCVEVGQRIAAGERISLLAASGDRSAAETHLHVSLREGESYLDPGPVVGACPPLPPDAEEEPPAQPGTEQILPPASNVVVPPDTTAVAAARGGDAAEEVGPDTEGTVAQDAAEPRKADVPGGIGAVVPSGGVADVPLAGAMPVGAGPARGSSILRWHGEDAQYADLADEAAPTRRTHAAGPTRGQRAGRWLPVTAGVVLGVAMLWPLWKKKGSTDVDVTPSWDDVAAAAGR